MAGRESELQGLQTCIQGLRRISIERDTCQQQLHTQKRLVADILGFSASMHDAICQPSVGLTEGLGLILEPSHSVGEPVTVTSVLEGGRAHASGMVASGDQ
eukprot:1597973-Rhodomonas_salina.1